MRVENENENEEEEENNFKRAFLSTKGNSPHSHFVSRSVSIILRKEFLMFHCFFGDNNARLYGRPYLPDAVQCIAANFYGLVSSFNTEQNQNRGMSHFRSI